MNNRQVVWIGFLFLSTFAVNLVLNTPAIQLLRFIELPAEIGIHGVQGTIMEGRVDKISYESFDVLDVHFRLQPTCLFKISICYQINSEGGEILLNVERNLLTQRNSITDSLFKLDIEQLENIPRLLVQPKGQFDINIKNFESDDSSFFDLEAIVDWINAGIEGEDQILGNYQAELTTEPGKLNIYISNSDSQLSVAGSIHVKWNGSYTLDLGFESRETLNPSVISILDMMTKKVDLNRYVIKRTGKVSPDIGFILQKFDTKG